MSVRLVEDVQGFDASDDEVHDDAFVAIPVSKRAVVEESESGMRSLVDQPSHERERERERTLGLRCFP